MSAEVHAQIEVQAKKLMLNTHHSFFLVHIQEAKDKCFVFVLFLRAEKAAVSHENNFGCCLYQR